MGNAAADIEVINAIKPSMATVPGAMLLCASSPHARRGALWDAHRKHYGQDGDPVLVWKAPTRVMNPSVPQSCIDASPKRVRPRKRKTEQVRLAVGPPELFQSLSR